MKFWDSSRESKIEVKLVGVEDKNIFVLVTSGRKTLRVTGAQLSLASSLPSTKLKSSAASSEHLKKLPKSLSPTRLTGFCMPSLPFPPHPLR
jgi:hypothetical protein